MDIISSNEAIEELINNNKWHWYTSKVITVGYVLLGSQRFRSF